jgi:hypothetical protein
MFTPLPSSIWPLVSIRLPITATVKSGSCSIQIV